MHRNFVRVTFIWISMILRSASRVLAEKDKNSLLSPVIDKYEFNLNKTSIDNLLLRKRRIRDVKVTEYMHIPKCGTLIYRNVCEGKKMLSCLNKTTLLNRKCGLIGEHCDWLSKYTCHKRYNRKKTKDLVFFTLLRDPVSRVRSYYAYFRSSACRSDRPKGSGWSKNLCSKVGNYSEWLLDESNWAHN